MLIIPFLLLSVYTYINCSDNQKDVPQQSPQDLLQQTPPTVPMSMQPQPLYTSPYYPQQLYLSPSPYMQPPPIAVHLHNSNSSTTQPHIQTHATSSPQVQANPHVEANPHVHAQSQANAEAQAAAQAHAFSYATLSNYVHNSIEHMQTYIHDNGIDQYPEHLQRYAYTYRYHLIAAGLVTAYAIFCTYFYRVRSHVAYQCVWSNWHSEKTFSELLQQDSTVTTNQLLLAIQSTYTNPTNPTDFLSPIVCFYTEVQKEIELLEKYQWYYSLYKKIYLTRCIPFNLELLDTLQERINRTRYLQGLFKQWMAYYNLQQQHHIVGKEAGNRAVEFYSKNC